ncbi:MAG: hypothetical protein ACE5LB_04305, partial [Acidiferrobacterales bacterium]
MNTNVLSALGQGTQHQGRASEKDNERLAAVGGAVTEDKTTSGLESGSVRPCPAKGPVRANRHFYFHFKPTRWGVNMKATALQRQPARRVRLLASLSLLGLVFGFSDQQEALAQTCARNLSANVVVFDQPLMWNRLGAQNVNGIVYALRRDVVAIDPMTGEPTGVPGSGLEPGKVALRPDKSPRPRVLRVRVGDCLTVYFQNLLTSNANPFQPVEERSGMPFNLDKNNQVADRHASFHVTGMQLVDGIADD